MDLHIQRYEYQLDQYIDGFIEKPVRYQSLYKTINQYIYKTGHSLFSKNGPVEILLEQVQKENYRQAKECVNTFLDTFKKHTRPNMETIQQTIRILTDSMIKICEAKGIKEMVNIDHLGNVFTLNSAKTYLKSFLYEIFKALTAKQAKVGASNIQTVLNYIELYYMKGICLEDVANFVHLSPHYVSRLFKKEAKTTFINYVTERKIAHAKELLKNTDLSVVNIAMELSFQEHTYFSKVFKKYCGLTPTEYRKKVRDQLGQITHNWNQRKIDSWYI